VIDVANAIDVSVGLINVLTVGTTILVADMAATGAFSLGGLQALHLARPQPAGTEHSYGWHPCGPTSAATSSSSARDRRSSVPA
jgi:hypothetical protein